MDVDTLAHPFMLIKDKRYYVFFTAKDLKSDKGGIGLAESADGLKWKFRRTVIREPFVQSHPFVFEWKGEYYLIPEAHTETSVRLYKATAFPDQWKYEGTCWKATTSSARRWRTTRTGGGSSRHRAGTTRFVSSTHPVSTDRGKSIP